MRVWLVRHLRWNAGTRISSTHASLVGARARIVFDQGERARRLESKTVELEDTECWELVDEAGHELEE